jgi:hypothetical protein
MIQISHVGPWIRLRASVFGQRVRLGNHTVQEHDWRHDRQYSEQNNAGR